MQHNDQCTPSHTFSACGEKKSYLWLGDRWNTGSG